MPSKQERCRSTFFLVSLECFRKKLEPRRCIRVSSLARNIHARLVHAGWCLKAKRADKGGILLSSCAPHIILLALAYRVLRARRGSSFMICHTSSFILDIPLPSASPTSKNFQRRFICHNVTTSGRYLGATWHQKHHITTKYLLSTKYEIRTQPRHAES